MEWTWYGMVWYGMAWHGMAWHGMAWHGTARHGMAWYGMVWYCMVWYGKVWYGMVWYGMVWFLAGSAAFLAAAAKAARRSSSARGSFLTASEHTCPDPPVDTVWISFCTTIKPCTVPAVRELSESYTVPAISRHGTRIMRLVVYLGFSGYRSSFGSVSRIQVTRRMAPTAVGVK